MSKTILICFILLATIQDLYSQTITTFAGTGNNGYSGDGGPALPAQFNTPIAVAIDKKGNVYIADHGNLKSAVLNTFPTDYADQRR